MGPKTQATDAADYRSQWEAERDRREALEERVRQLDAIRMESERKLEETDRDNRVRSKLRELGVRKLDLAMRVVGGEVHRGDDGVLYGRSKAGSVLLDDFLKAFVSENPEFLPPRISGGSGSIATDGNGIRSTGIQMESIRPGMNGEDSRRAWREVARLLGRQGSPGL